MRLFLFINLIISSTCFILPQIVREWHVIGIDKYIQKTSPYSYNIGKLPMVLWYDKNEEPLSAINICKHLGSRLNNGIIKNGCLYCPNHNIEYNKTDTIGNVIKKNGLLWWSYKSYKKNPPAIFNENITDIYQFYIDVNVNLLNVILEFVFSNNKNKILNYKNKFFFNEIYNDLNHKYFYKYPYFLKGSFNNKYKYCINFLPLDNNKTRLFISINGNNIYCKNKIFYFINNKLKNLKNYDNTNYLKYLIILNNQQDINNKNINYLKNIQLLFDKYSFPDEFTTTNFYKYRQFY